MNKLKFKIAILDEFGYPISRYGLNIEGEIDEESVRKALDEKISEITVVMLAVENESKFESAVGRK